jgi:uncharacterized membrane protein
MTEKNDAECKFVRWVSWAMSVFGHYCLFSPVIALLAWIPLVGHLLASALTFAVIVFALLWASVLHILVLGFAWVFYRPIFGGLLLASAFTIVHCFILQVK